MARKYSPEQFKARYRSRKAAGLCVCCGKTKDTPFANCSECRMKNTERSERARLMDPLKARFQSLKHSAKKGKYAAPCISLQEFKLWFESKQAKGKCDACGQSYGEETPCVDHCHETGHLRGLLHRECNRLEGRAGKIPGVLAYWHKHHPEQFSDGGGI